MILYCFKAIEMHVYICDETEHDGISRRNGNGLCRRSVATIIQLRIAVELHFGKELKSYTHQTHPSSLCLKDPCQFKHLDDFLLYLLLKRDLSPQNRDETLANKSIFHTSPCNRSDFPTAAHSLPLEVLSASFPKIFWLSVLKNTLVPSLVHGRNNFLPTGKSNESLPEKLQEFLLQWIPT